MNILLVSQCNKNALKETRRILDQFAERIGERTWQTPITWAGLDTLRRMLRRSARKNTAVACHWIKGRDHSELLWIVGDASRFNAHGAVPTDTTSRDVLRRDDEDDWHTGEDIRLLASLAALLHDLGKGSAAFQGRLAGEGGSTANLYRHEWISLRLLEAFAGGDDDAAWLGRLRDIRGQKDDTVWRRGLIRDGLDSTAPSPFQHLPPLAAAVGWLILSHHRLPDLPAADKEGFRSQQLEGLPAIITAAWNQDPGAPDLKQVRPYWRFDHPLPVVTRRWQQRASRLAEQMLRREIHRRENWLDNPYVLHLARLSLMLADHHYSSLEDPSSRSHGAPGYPLYANTARKTGELSQPLDEHLLGVEAAARTISRSLPSVTRFLPRLARHKGFRRRSKDSRFRWQDRAFDLAASLRDKAFEQGFFGVNMASTGYGKTLAHGRIAYALADPERGARFSVALGLRTLTLQTGRAYQELLRLGEDDLAIRVGGSASRTLFAYYEEQSGSGGSASRQCLIEEDSHVYFEGDFENHPVLKRAGHDPSVKALIAAPVLVSTVDHLVPATEGVRGGRQIAPMMRLMSSDLILDEIDDYGLEDMPALARLVHWAGLLGGRVILSSATLPPALLEGLFRAYWAGRSEYQRNRGEPGRPTEIVCAWFDEHARQHEDCADLEAFAAAHQRFASRRHERLGRAEARRRARLVSLPVAGSAGKAEAYDGFAETVRANAAELHGYHHTVDPRSGKRVSFGLIRMANIDPLVRVAQSLIRQGAPSGYRFHLCVYHSQFPLVTRSAIEYHLDRALDRREEMAVFDLPEIRAAIDGSEESHNLFLVLGSPVTEVGRDHDYDWAIVEPSSMRSLIQIAGRVRRHRPHPCETPNLALLQTNLKALLQPGGPAFTRPGFEGGGSWRLNSHDLQQLLRPAEYEVVDARPRILQQASLAPHDSLVDLEHARLRRVLQPPPSAEAAQGSSRRHRRRSTGRTASPLSAATWYELPRVTLTGVLPRQQPFRQQTTQQTELVLMPDESGERWFPEQIRYDRGQRQPSAYVPADRRVHHVTLEDSWGERLGRWAVADYLTALGGVAEELGWSLERCARVYGVVTLPLSESEQEWSYHDLLGFTRRHQ
ncbi:type I-F CRISPR-associated helicase Cas3f [Halorhodospira neutriphila]|uniref:Type I-F CRISPR-associated helicase Cas3 n=1 Tax=Halorhodospira neutriphila TaxID=168379 RepID=A0ABS1E2V1_9GAMM|nr:type I-F CRISPR-associated helicase Cas3f [Halorhodospira neutriphila]MBK1726033.1 type I-F CRISPR-associated helicase Cas3 [Halorhodospira neutriphila]